MPIHDWTRVIIAVFHDFHHSWIEEIKRALNGGILPSEYYALAEQYAGRFGPDVLALPHEDSQYDEPGELERTPVVALAPPPKAYFTATTEMQYYVENMPLFLEPEACVNVPIDSTYQAAWREVPRRWRQVLELSGPL